MRVLALADKRPPLDPALMAEQMGVEAVVCLGDLDRAWIEPLAAPALDPRLGVHGNHDQEDVLREVEVQDIHGRRTSLGGMTFAGFAGCVRYGRGGPYHYTQREARSWPSGCRPPTCCSATARRSGSTTIPTIRPTSASRACATGSSATGRATSCTGTRIPVGGQVMTPLRATRCTGSRARA